MLCLDRLAPNYSFIHSFIHSFINLKESKNIVSKLPEQFSTLVAPEVSDVWWKCPPAWISGSIRRLQTREVHFLDPELLYQFLTSALGILHLHWVQSCHQVCLLVCQILSSSLLIFITFSSLSMFTILSISIDRDCCANLLISSSLLAAFISLWLDSVRPMSLIATSHHATRGSKRKKISHTLGQQF